jgi:hypothetical protein
MKSVTPAAVQETGRLQRLTRFVSENDSPGNDNHIFDNRTNHNFWPTQSFRFACSG